MGVALLLVGTFVLATGCATAPGSVSVVAGRPDDSGGANTTLEIAVHDLVNEHRRGRGLPPLTLESRISRVARAHSAAMAAGKVRLGHDGFADRATMLGQDEQRSVAENVAYERGHASPASEIFQGWLRSRRHRENIEGPYDRTGIGAARNAAGGVYFTQIFVGSRHSGR